MSTQSNTQTAYGWTSADHTCAHDYTLPCVLAHVRQHSEKLGRALRVLDLGCGNGSTAAKIHEAGHLVKAVDVSSDGIEIAGRAWPNVEFKVASVYDEDLVDLVGDGFDCIVSLDVVEHLYFPAKLLERSRALLAPDGILILSTPYHGYWKNLAISLMNGWDKHFSVHQDGGHIKFFSPNTLKHMLSSVGFNTVTVSGVGRLPWLWKAMVLVAAK